ncbi:MAG: hydroxymethylglutaryl-CoA lyase [Sphingomonadales bacterium]|nr:hydroxymethylglutaryl-CoA lyase [Sphingomonadales bacterium]
MNNPSAIHNEAFCLVECPRDAMQGIHQFIPTEVKTAYLNLLLEVGFDIIDCGSFVSPKAIPQMADTSEVLNAVNRGSSQSRLLCIVANDRGGEMAARHEQVDVLGFPFSVSETFQINNTGVGRIPGLKTIEQLVDRCHRHQKELVVYLSMGFGNPYGEDYVPEMVWEWTKRLDQLGVRTLSLSDTIGMATPEQIRDLFGPLKNDFAHLVLGLHLHAHPGQRDEKISAAYQSGCRRFDGALLGFGGCPMAQDDMVGNLATEHIVQFARKQGININLVTEKWHQAQWMATGIFGSFH